MQLEFPCGLRECSRSKVHLTGCMTLWPLPAAFEGIAGLTKFDCDLTATPVEETIGALSMNDSLAQIQLG